MSISLALSSQPTGDDLGGRVALFLGTSPYPALRKVQVQAVQGTVTLRGTVHSFYEKQLCNEFSRRVAGVQQVIDEVDVVDRRSPAAERGGSRLSSRIGNSRSVIRN